MIGIIRTLRMKTDLENLHTSIHGSTNDDWTHQPESKAKLNSAKAWMQQYIADYPDDGRSSWWILHKVFQCDVHELGTLQLSAVVDTLRKIKTMDWNGLLADEELDCKEIAGESGKYTLRLSDLHRAIVGRDGRRLVFLVLSNGGVAKTVDHAKLSPTGRVSGESAAGFAASAVKG